MPPLSVLFKTVSTDCNLDCSYCYYRQSLEGTRVRRRIDRGMLEVLLPQYMEYVADVGQAGFAWQGGEPTLAGLEFFGWVVDLQEGHARPGRNDPCPCGSGRKHKACCGDPALSQSYLFRQVG